MENTCYMYIFAAYSLLIGVSSLDLATDESALLALKSNIQNTTFLSTNWTEWSSVCNWIGVTCGSRHHRVTALNLSGMGLSGTIPPLLGNLSFLRSLDLSYNFFSGTLPQELSLLRRLKSFYLEVNDFTGEIPSSLGLLSNLKVFSLENNSFSGPIPVSLSNLTNLKLLTFYSNSLQGNIPEEWGRLPSLQYLSLEENQLSGGVPSALFNISTLEILELTSNKLSGILPIDMCRNLPFLERIKLSFNQLSGTIPWSISECSSLQVLSLSFNAFSGEIPPQIGRLKSLTTLFLGYNNLTGILPKETGNLHSLEVCGISHNQISGNLPREIGNLSAIKYLDLLSNNFTGVIPKEIGKLYHLERLFLDFNSITGPVPAELFNISTLQSVSIVDNNLWGPLPTNMCYGSPLLRGLFFGGNSLIGSIPQSISNCSKLRRLELTGNKFNGFVPHFFGNLRFLESLNLDNNTLTTESSSSELSFIASLTSCTLLKDFSIVNNPLGGVIPISIGNLSSHLESFKVTNCKIMGSIPAEIGNLSNLILLSLGRNELSGNLPQTVKHLHKLQGLSIAGNKIEGYIPESLCHLQSLGFLFLSKNQLSGSIPECVGNVTSLRLLDLDSNLLTSTVPSSLWRLTDLLHLNLSSNSLRGTIPPEIGNLAVATYVDLSLNQLSGSIPTTIGKLQNLVNLYLEHNRLESSIPVSMGSMISLKTIDFSNNNLSGLIPKSLETLGYLRYFNVSFNALSGEIPTSGPFRNFTMESFKGNKALCGIQRFHVPLCPVYKRGSKKGKVGFALFILAGVVVLFAVVSLAFIFKRYKNKDSANGTTNEHVLSTLTQRISYYEILQATQHFNETNILGIGSFGSVYRGILRDGKVIAAKVFNLQNEASFRSFDVECEVLRNIRHRNLTKVLSSCSNEEFKALVLEYMPNGNLEKWLYSHNYCLDVEQRVNIMIDVASALEYLHHGNPTPIVHCDLKPSNVLLDEEMIAHVSDFGIAKMASDEESIVLTNTLATLGYIAPEYGLEGLVSTRCDVYSYGVILMETFTRKRPSDNMFGGDLSLKGWVERSLVQSPTQIIDANLLTNPQKEKKQQCVSSILDLALKCSVESPKERINMKQALLELNKIKHRFLQDPRHGAPAM